MVEELRSSISYRQGSESCLSVYPVRLLDGSVIFAALNMNEQTINMVKGKHIVYLVLREKCPYLELFWSAFSRIRTEYGEILRISPYSVRMQENADQNNSEYRHFLRNVTFCGNCQGKLYFCNLTRKVVALPFLVFARFICKIKY